MSSSLLHRCRVFRPPPFFQTYPHNHGTFTRPLRTTSCPRAQYIRFREIPPTGKPNPGPYPYPSQPQGPGNHRKWDGRIIASAWVAGLGTLYYVFHLEQLSETGRWRFMNTSREAEEKVGAIERNRLKEELGGRILPPNHPIVKHTRRIVSRLLAASDLGQLTGDPTLHEHDAGVPFGAITNAWNMDADDGGLGRTSSYEPAKKSWDVIVVNDINTINAMALPGLVVVFTGILPVCQDEQGLSAVLAHEIGHVVARHTAERLSSQTILLGLAVLAHLLGFDWGFSSAIQKFCLELPNSRTQEREADLIGLRLMARACYDPMAAPKMFNRLGRLENEIAAKVGLEFMRTHPSSANRVKYLEQAVPEANAILANNPDCHNIRSKYEKFRATAQGIRLDDHGGRAYGIS